MSLREATSSEMEKLPLGVGWGEASLLVSAKLPLWKRGQETRSFGKTGPRLPLSTMHRHAKETGNKCFAFTRFLVSTRGGGLDSSPMDITVPVYFFSLRQGRNTCPHPRSSFFRIPMYFVTQIFFLPSFQHSWLYSQDKRATSFDYNSHNLPARVASWDIICPIILVRTSLVPVQNAVFSIFEIWPRTTF